MAPTDPLSRARRKPKGRLATVGGVTYDTTDRAARTRTRRAVAATVAFVGVGAVAHQIGTGVPVQVVPLCIIAVLVAPVIWLIVPTVSLSRALAAAFSAQVIMVTALLSMEPSTGGSATRATVHPGHPALRLDDAVSVADTGLSVALIQAHLAMALLTCVLLVVADDTLQTLVRSGVHVRVPRRPADHRRRAVTADR
jgi:hypothetical protein